MARKKSSSKEITITRVYDAPVKMVWEAWTDVKQVAQWWGPRGFTLTTHSKELRPGGIWHYTMHGPDGTDYENKTLYHEVVEHSRLVYDHGGNDERAPLFRVQAQFTALKGDKTKMELSFGLATPEAAEEMKKHIKKVGGNSTWDRLGEYLVQESSGKDKFIINRTFEAPIAMMYEVWTDPKHFSQWLPPTGFTMKFIRADIKEGGTTFYSMTGTGHGPMSTMYGRAKYLELRRPDRIVYTQQFCDENEKVTRHPLSPTWPETMLTTVTLAEEGPDETRVTITWEVHGQATSEERDTFKKAKSGMTQGWGGSFDKLEGYLERLAEL